MIDDNTFVVRALGVAALVLLVALSGAGAIGAALLGKPTAVFLMAFFTSFLALAFSYIDAQMMTPPRALLPHLIFQITPPLAAFLALVVAIRSAGA
jgi:hypothetical protein